jgi:hypothetical protein
MHLRYGVTAQRAIAVVDELISASQRPSSDMPAPRHAVSPQHVLWRARIDVLSGALHERL